MDLKRVVITGLGTINPLGHNVPEFWDNLLKGVSGAGPITRFDASKFRTQFACEVKNYEPTGYFDRCNMGSRNRWLADFFRGV